MEGFGGMQEPEGGMKPSKFELKRGLSPCPQRMDGLIWSGRLALAKGGEGG